MISLSARCCTVACFKYAAPYSVTMQSTSALGTVTGAPAGNQGIILLIVPPRAVAGNAKILRPLLDDDDPRIKSKRPP